ncbi:MAG: diacylglycerol O-acyltransferase / wax synthase, partial [Actinomycetota bacterium]|nr:diacylglycerol O-acyltransferase / wax synthase [Actinomycetota bacterium]
MADTPEHAPASKAPAKKAPAGKAAAKKAPAKSAPAKSAPAKKAPAKKSPAKTAPSATKAAAAKTPPRVLRGNETVTQARRMGGWDFATWRMATDDPVMRSTILGVMVLDQNPDWDKLCDRYERASRLAPVLRSKVVEGPLDFQTPRVVVDPNFDLSFHMRRFS